jgi:hypothetical protein
MIQIEWYNTSGSLFKKAFDNREAAEDRIKEISAMNLAEETRVFTLNVQSEFEAINNALKGE